MAESQLKSFIRQSNLIEGITRDPTEAEIDATERFVSGKATVETLERLVTVYEPGAQLRFKLGMDVRVGRHVPPRGGVQVVVALRLLLERATLEDLSPWETHLGYETLHLFTDGNGRSGRALWAWQMRNSGRLWGRPLSFLHAFYYQTLQEVR